MPSPSAPLPSLLLRIELADIEPTIWRHVLVPPAITLAQLHDVLQASLGWHDLHLHEFHIDGINYGVPDPDGGDSPPLQDEAGKTLLGVLGSATSFNYVYDFGDDWEHQITVQPYRPAKHAPPAPVCLDGANAGPPEDVGGPWAFGQFVEAMADPRHPEHETMLDWHGQPFDPQAWDIERVNRRLKRLSHTWRRHDLNIS
ncbi:plasmid pRiA4b ORF-3 family protein [Pseudomonas sp. M47T1]|uniref:plasmid pRiA4b ORF-3 family protein n=1 Tax=unclassified Pseudomonas TaxID=196821 RepID=UPI000260805E|nr:plasmid pRiA4b ORF-3 family protein [Pseudomonas sp. M47T1]EIK93930.1 plasmid pRiA4b ORF-3 family protein [Pseudomonas sp. M47T1]